MDMEKRNFAGWWLFIVILFLLTLPVFWALSAAGLFGRTVTERVIFENSYQKTAGDKSKAAIFRAQLVEIETKLRSATLPQKQRMQLEAQRSAIRVQLASIEGN